MKFREYVTEGILGNVDYDKLKKLIDMKLKSGKDVETEDGVSDVSFQDNEDSIFDKVRKGLSGNQEKLKNEVKKELSKRFSKTVRFGLSSGSSITFVVEK